MADDKRKIRMEENEIQPVHPDNKGFREKITPKPLAEEKDVFFFKCSCGKCHFRHAGYMEILVPFVRPGDERCVAKETKQVKICVSCRKSYVWINEQMYDVTDLIDVNAWAEFEDEIHDAVGPGGDC